MSDECWVTVVRAWSQANRRSQLLIRMINNHGQVTRDRPFTTIDEAVDQLRRWLIEFEQSLTRTDTASTTRHGDDATETPN